MDTTSIIYYGVKVTLYFKAYYLLVYGLYLLLSDHDIQHSILKYIKNEYAINKTYDYYYTVVLGDLNFIVDSFLDCTGNTRIFRHLFFLVNFLVNNLYIDTYRFLHPTHAYT